MASNKSILFFCSFPPPFTGQRIATQLIYDLLDKSATVDFINLSTEQDTIKKAGFLKIFFVYISKYFLLAKKIRQHNYDIVYAVFAPSKAALLKDIFSTLVVKLFSKTKLIAHLHCGNYGDNFNQPLFKYLFRQLINKVDTFVFLSPILNKLSLDINKAFYLTNTISNEIICTGYEIEQKFLLKQNRRALNIYFISNMIKEKGYNDLIAAAALLNKRPNINYTMHLIGDWPDINEKQKLENDIKNLASKNKIIIYGSIANRQQIKEHLLNADIFVLPTYYPIEAQPLSIIEAFNAATPVVSTFHASIPEMVDEGINGFLVQKNSPREIADAIEKLSLLETWRTAALNARKKYCEHYNPDIFLQRLIRLFN